MDGEQAGWLAGFQLAGENRPGGHCRQPLALPPPMHTLQPSPCCRCCAGLLTLQVLPVEVLHGFTFALAWGGGCAYCAQLSPPGLEATTQGLFQGERGGQRCRYLGAAIGSMQCQHMQRFCVHGPLLRPPPVTCPPPLPSRPTQASTLGLALEWAALWVA
jgi:hypothetical protein